MNGYELVRGLRVLLNLAAVFTLLGGVWWGMETSSSNLPNAWVWVVGGILGALVTAAQAQFISLVLDVEERTRNIGVALDTWFRQGSPSPEGAPPSRTPPTSPGPGVKRRGLVPARRAAFRRPFADAERTDKKASPSRPSGAWTCPQCSTRQPAVVTFCTVCSTAVPRWLRRDPRSLGHSFPIRVRD